MGLLKKLLILLSNYEKDIINYFNNDIPFSMY